MTPRKAPTLIDVYAVYSGIYGEPKIEKTQATLSGGINAMVWPTLSGYGHLRRVPVDKLHRTPTEAVDAWRHQLLMDATALEAKATSLRELAKKEPLL